MSDLINREDAVKTIIRMCAPICDATNDLVAEINALPSADAESDDLIIKGAKGIKDGLYNITDGKLFEYKAKGGTVRTYPILPSAEAVSREDYHNLLTATEDIDRALREYQAKDENPSAEAVQVWRIGKLTEQGAYMVTLDAFGHKRIDLFYYGKPMMPNRKVRGKCWYRSDDEWGDVVYDDKDILAWMPLPKPYREENDSTEKGESHDQATGIQLQAL